MSPVQPSERLTHLDLLRGIALFGVLLVNALSGFSMSLYNYMPGPPPSLLVAELFEFRAMSLFAFLFGVGVAIQSGRIAKPHAFLLRRFAALFAIGVAHIVLLWNGDILCLYAVCGMLLLPFLRLRARWLLLAALVLKRISLPVALPGADALRAHGAEATRVYSTGAWTEILVYRCQEAIQWDLPLWLSALPLTLGLMMLGMAAWRHPVMRRPQDHRPLLLVVFGAGVAGAMLDYWFDLDMPWVLAAAYGSAILLWLDPSRLPAITSVGRMALTNYLAQSLIMTWIFNGYGLGLFGRLGAGAVTAIAIAVYALQAWWSVMWLQRHAQGPVERLWRRASYGF